MSFNDSFAGYLLFEIMMRVLNNKNRKNKCVPGKKGIFIYLQRKHYFGSCYCYNNFYVVNSFGDKLHNSS